MRFSSHLSSSTFNTGKLEAARVNPSFKRRGASSRPRRCGIEITRGAGIFEILFALSRGSSIWLEKKSDPTDAVQKNGTFPVPLCFSSEGRATHAHCRVGRRG